jgi:hypothetical protein
MIRASGFSAFVEPDRSLGTVAHSTVWLYETTALFVHVQACWSWRRGRFGRPGTLELSGLMTLPELRAEVVFRRSGERPPGVAGGDEQRASASLVPPRTTLTIPHHSIPAPLPENVDLWVLTARPDREPPWDEHYAGNSRERAIPFERHISVTAVLGVSVHAEECQRGRGTRVELAGELRFDRRVQMRMLVRDPASAVGPPSERGSCEVELIARDTRVPIWRQTVSGLMGPNPTIAVRVTDGVGQMVCPERVLGRSVRFG